LLFNLGPTHWRSFSTLPFSDFSNAVCYYLKYKLFFHSFSTLKSRLLMVGLNIKPILITDLPSCPPFLRTLCSLLPFINSLLTYLCTLFRSQYYVVSSCN
jgi:uncharacterized membrane protein